MRRRHGDRAMIGRLKRASGEVRVSVRDMAQDRIGSL
jgi:hypothetical protein